MASKQLVATVMMHPTDLVNKDTFSVAFLIRNYLIVRNLTQFR